MSHHIYNTKSFVIDTIPSGESDYMVVMYTEDFGLISAIAKGLREMKSKLRYSLQKLSFGTVALVRGRELWRVTNASTDISLFNKALHLSARDSLASLLKFVQRFCQGEDRNDDIFESIKNYSSLIFRNQRDLSAVDLEIAQLVTKLRIMYSLGYVKNSAVNKNILTELYTIENIETWKADEDQIRSMIDEAVQISHL
ncbi:MAG: recombination protein O N-terminal domain-containing protein [bacterium]